MFITIRRMMEWIILFVFFFFLVFQLYKITLIVNDFLNPIQYYREPKAKSVRVIDMEFYPPVAKEHTIIERLKFFYWFGE